MASNLYPPYVSGGAEVYVRNITEELIKRGHDVVVITTSPTNRSYIEKNNKHLKIYRVRTNVYPYYTKDKYPQPVRYFGRFFDESNLYSYYTIKKILKKEKPNIVHIHNFLMLSVLIFKVTKELRLPTIFTAHDYGLICPKSSLLRERGICTHQPLPCRMYKTWHKYIVNGRVDLVTAPSNFVLKILKESGLFMDIPSFKLPLGVKLNNKKIKKTYETFDILFVGSLNWHKGVHILIRAFRKLNGKHLKLHIVGKGENMEKFKELAKGDSRIRFYGFVPEEMLYRLYEIANVGVVPSIWYDNSPVVIYEHLSNGHPVVGSKIGGIPELINNRYNGLLVTPGVTNELKDGLEYLVSDIKKLKRFEKNANTSIKEYSMDKHIKKIEKIYYETSR